MKIFSIEPTNHCNAKCWFCPHSTNLHSRKRGMMTLNTVHRILQVIDSNTCSINGLGEPLMNPVFLKIVKAFRRRGIRLLINTNGKLLNQSIYDSLAKAGVSRLIVADDYFGWDKEIRQRPSLKIEHIVVDTEPNAGEVKKEMYDWAGRIKDSRISDTAHPKLPTCSYIEDDWVQVLWDGTIVRCCQDFNGDEPLGHINDNEKSFGWKGKGISFCENCQGYKFQNALVVGDYKGEGEKK